MTGLTLAAHGALDRGDAAVGTEDPGDDLGAAAAHVENADASARRRKTGKGTAKGELRFARAIDDEREHAEHAFRCFRELGPAPRVAHRARPHDANPLGRMAREVLGVIAETRERSLDGAPSELAQAASTTQLVPPRSKRLAMRPAATLPSRPGKEFSCQGT